MGNSAPGYFTYFAGGLVQEIPEQLPEGFKKQELAAGEYIVCKIEAESFEDLATVALNQAMAAQTQLYDRAVCSRKILLQLGGYGKYGNMGEAFAV